MNEVFEKLSDVFEELRSEADEREYSIQTEETKKADKELKKANREYEKLLSELSAEQRNFLENYMDIVDHAHFQEQQRAYYQGIVDANQENSIIADFREKTNELFHDISEMNPAEIEETVKCHVQAKIDEYLSLIHI